MGLTERLDMCVATGFYGFFPTIGVLSLLTVIIMSQEPDKMLGEELMILRGNYEIAERERCSSFVQDNLPKFNWEDCKREEYCSSMEDKLFSNHIKSPINGVMLGIYKLKRTVNTGVECECIYEKVGEERGDELGGKWAGKFNR